MHEERGNSNVLIVVRVVVGPGHWACGAREGDPHVARPFLCCSDLERSRELWFLRMLCENLN